MFRIDPIKILPLTVIGASESTTSGGTVKKFTVKQGEPIQLICKVDGYPEPKVTWIKRVSTHTETILIIFILCTYVHI